MINARLDLYILALSPNQINVLLDTQSKFIIPSKEITNNYDIEYQLKNLLKEYYNTTTKIDYANFRFVNINIVDGELVVSYMMIIGSLDSVISDNTHQYAPIENVANEYNQKIIQKIKNIV